MPKSLTLGNGNILVCLDKYGQIRDLYYHYAGLENHVGAGMVHKIGFWVDESFSWIDDGLWEVTVDYEKETMAGRISAKNPNLGVEVNFCDVVYNEKNIFLREVSFKNLFDRNRKIKIFFNQEFNIGGTLRGDTSYYDPNTNVIIHYEGRRVFLINASVGEKSFTDYTIGLFAIEGREGTFKDAEDGVLSKSPIEYGQVDSVISCEVDLSPNAQATLYYFLTVGKSVREVKNLNDYVLEKTPAYLVKSTKDYWNAWVHNQRFTFYSLSESIVDLFNKSLVIIRTHVSSNGAIIASADSDMLFYGRDTYSYVWPRDAAISSIALAMAGDFNASRRFFEFCKDTISEDGFFLHKYRPDKSLGSSWHPWIRNGKAEFPIQEDETALVIYALRVYYELSKDLEFIESLYNPLIKKAAEFMVSYMDEARGLPKPSYDLWEMKFGIHTFTAACVYGALKAAGDFARLLGKEKSAEIYLKGAERIGKAIIDHLYDRETGFFYKSVNFENGEVILDRTIDVSSAWGVYKFAVLPFDEPLLKRAFEQTRERLALKTEIGGIARFEGDVYHGQGGNIPGNPWFITSLWSTQYKMQFVQKEEELPEIVRDFTWVVAHALPSGIISEQINPYSGEQLSAAPLIWSHAEYVIAVISYLMKLEKLGICKACYPIT